MSKSAHMTDHAVNQPPVPGGLIPYGDYLNTFTDGHTEWIDGEVVPMTPVGYQHQNLGSFLLALIRVFNDLKRVGAVAYEPFQMKTGPDLPGRSPDILFVSNHNLSRLKETHLDGPADLVVEIISPDSGARDRGEKYDEYERGGVREYWLLDPERREAFFFVLGADGHYHATPTGPDGLFRSVVLPGLWLKTEWLWQEPLPSTVDVLREWKLI